MKEYLYYGYNSGSFRAFREDGSVVFDRNTNKPLAFIEDGCWYDYNTHEYIAFEEKEIVFNAKTMKPILFFEERE